MTDNNSRIMCISSNIVIFVPKKSKRHSYIIQSFFTINKIQKQLNFEFICTALSNHNRIVYQEMSSWTALTWYIGIKTAFKTKHVKSKCVWIFIMMIFNFHDIIRNAYYHWSSSKTQFYELLVIESCISLYMHFLQSL